MSPFLHKLYRARKLAALRKLSKSSKLGSAIDAMAAEIKAAKKGFTGVELDQIAQAISGDTKGKIALVQDPKLLRAFPGITDAAFVSPEKLKLLNPDLISKFGLQQYIKEGKGIVVVGASPTFLQTTHELAHLEHWLLDPKTYDALSSAAKEEFVMQRVLWGPRWNNLTRAEQLAQLRAFQNGLDRSILEGSAATEIERLTNWAKELERTRVKPE